MVWRVGDRITVAGVTGDVIEVGLVRFYMMELAGSGTELHSTGRVAVFANSILFQTGNADLQTDARNGVCLS